MTVNSNTVNSNTVVNQKELDILQYCESIISDTEELESLIAKDYLDNEGYVVLHNILNDESINKGLDLFWKDWNTVSPDFNKDDPSTWSIKTSPMMFAKGMAVFNGFGQSDFMWHLRLQPEIIDIFAKIYNDNNLITSFDGFSVFFDKAQKSPKDWWHIDQHPKNPVYTVDSIHNHFV